MSLIQFPNQYFKKVDQSGRRSHDADDTMYFRPETYPARKTGHINPNAIYWKEDKKGSLFFRTNWVVTSVPYAVTRIPASCRWGKGVTVVLNKKRRGVRGI